MQQPKSAVSTAALSFNLEQKRERTREEEGEGGKSGSHKGNVKEKLGMKRTLCA